MKKHPLDERMAELFPPNLDVYPKEMQSEIARMRSLEARRKMIGLIIGALYHASLVVLLLIVAWFVAQAIDRDPPAHAEIMILTPQVRPGDKFKMEVTINRKRQCESRSIFQLYDGEANRKTIDLDWQPPKGLPGLDPPFVRTVMIPRDFAPGPGRLRIERQFRCVNNFFHQVWPIITVDPDLPFTILPAP